MVKRILAFVCVTLLLAAGAAFAEEAAQTAAAGAGVHLAQPNSVNYFIWTIIVAGLGLSIVASICGMAQGAAVTRAVEGIARQPEAAAKIQLVLMIGLAFIESLVLYTLFIGIVLLFVNPFSKYFIQ
jgi:F-type H+-transporting ATPase subunit c